MELLNQGRISSRFVQQRSMKLLPFMYFSSLSIDRFERGCIFCGSQVKILSIQIPSR